MGGDTLVPGMPYPIERGMYLRTWVSLPVAFESTGSHICQIETLTRLL